MAALRSASGRDAARRGSIPYEPALDGLRGFAMVAIAGFHASIPWLSGSFLALDLFFVLSGYLITRLLLSEWDKTGDLRLSAFWERRARRLLPAMLFALLGVAAFALLRGAPEALPRIRADILSTLFYANNWWQIIQGHSYFETFAGVSPLHHAWSLSLEEQWYLVWPLVVILVLRGRGRVEDLLWLSAVGSAISFAWMAWLYEPGGDPSRVYYGTDTRASEILLGAAAGCAAHLGAFRSERAERALSWLGTPALAALAFLWVGASHASPWIYRGGFLLVSLLSAVVILAAATERHNPARSLLAFTPMRWLGMISYGFYLWHLPVYLVLTRTATGLDGIALFALRLTGTLIIAALSYFALERPIRRGALRSPWALRLALLSTAGVAVIAVASTRPPATPAQGEVAAARIELPDLRGARELRVLLVGDSVAWSLANGFRPALERASGVRVINRAMPGCGLAHGRLKENGKILVRNSGSRCGDWPEHWTRYVVETRPDLVLVLVGGWDIYDREVEGEWLAFGSAAYDAYLRGLLERAGRVLGSGGARVVMLSSPYYHREDAASAMQPAISERWRIDRFNAVLRDYVASTRGAVTLLELGDWVCEDPRCEAQREGVALRTDGAHFSTQGAMLTAAWLAPQLHAIADDEPAELP